MAETKEITGFEVKIIQEDGNVIDLGESVIKSIRFKIDTVEEDVKDRSDNVINKVEVKGSITPESKKETRKLALWSLDKMRSKVYRKASLIIREGGEVLRTYEMDKVFCIDYIETFQSGSGNKGEFELIVAQRKDDLDGIQIGYE